MFPNINNANNSNEFPAPAVETSQLTNRLPSTFIRPSVLASQENSNDAYGTAFGEGSSHRQLQMPAADTPWVCPPWMTSPSVEPGSYMTFNADQRQAHMPVKRKLSADTDAIIKSKQLITEEKMTAHLNKMHISKNYTSHNSADDANGNAINITFDPEQSCSVQDIEQKLKQANRITVSDMVRSIRDDPLLPAAILERFERPSKALVLWQPPQRLTEMIVAKVAEQSGPADDERNDDGDDAGVQDTNSVTQMDLDM